MFDLVNLKVPKMPQFASLPLQELERRGLIKDVADVDELDTILASGQKIAVYAGFDPTAGSLHVGHLATLTVLRVFAQHGHKVLPLIGTGTAMIGDPAGRKSARQMLSPPAVSKNADGVMESIGLALKGFPVEVVFNGDWIDNVDLVWFLREVGSRVSLSHLIAQDSVKSRLGGAGISFLEACYPLLQAWDFLQLSSKNPVLLQVGGSDQWGNLVMGLELISRTGTPGCQAFGLTHPLLTKSDGEKMGKTAGGAVWLNSSALGDYDFYRFWRTLPDADTPKIARMLSDLDPAVIVDGESGDGAERLKTALAFSMTSWIRGEAAALSAEAASRGRGAVADGLPEIEATESDLGDLASLMVKASLAESKGSARRLCEQGGLRVNGQPRIELKLTEADIVGGVVVLSAGRTRHCAIRVSPPLVCDSVGIGR